MNKSVVDQLREKYGHKVESAHVKSEATLGDILNAALRRSAKIVDEDVQRGDKWASAASKVVGDRSYEIQKFAKQVIDRENQKSSDMPASPKKLTGGLTNYYVVKVNNPQRVEQPPYQAECEDIIHALGMTFDEGCLFKALWRSAAARKGNGKPGNEAVYDAEKMVHYASRILKHVRNGNNG